LTGGPRQETPPATGGPLGGGGGDAANSATAGVGALTGGLPGAGAPGKGGAPLPDVRITPDISNNTILIYADEQEYRVIERAINQLDRPNLQVAIDVTIAEVTLNDQLNYGVQFFLRNGLGSVSNINGLSSPIDPVIPGFNIVVGNGASPRVILSALHQYTDVKILSNPSLVVVNNQSATLEVGDQVPVSTGSATVLSSNNAVVNTIDYKNTGIILHVQPRVSSNGTVLLQIEQEISNVQNNNATSNAASATSQNLTPTISQRRVKSELSVANGQTVLLAGLISETQNIAHTGIPVLDQIPVVGHAFGTDNKGITRTELILFIRPQIIRDGADASVVAEELRSKMRGGELGSLGLGKVFVPEPHRTLQ